MFSSFSDFFWSFMALSGVMFWGFMAVIIALAVRRHKAKTRRVYDV